MKTIVSDIGNVILFFDLERAVINLAEYCQDEELLFSLLWGSENQYELMKGALDPKEYFKKIKTVLNGISFEEFCPAFSDIMG